MKRRNLVLIAYVLICRMITAQDSADYVAYTPEYHFRDGIFTSIERVKNNDPIPKSVIISSADYDDPDFFERVLHEKEVTFFDNLGTTQKIPAENIWGYSQNGALYININEGFYRINIIGSICHFVANLTTYSSYYNPYSPYSYPYSYPYSPYYTPNTKSTEMHQYIMDFNTGTVYDYDVPAIEVLLMADPELYDQFMALSKRKKKQQKFLFIRTFNERHPLYLPVK